MYPEDLKYYKEHEWVRTEDDTAIVGISDYAQDSLGDIVYLELPEEGTQVKAGETFGEVESVKSVSQLFSPVTGEVVEVNTELVNQPEMINSYPYERGWMIKVRLTDPGELNRLMSAEEYERFVQQ
ncbi:MAG: glycine cleavage system protein GcvH [Actinobacteria bacterium]|nr:MAG: glycine cleavage system protein GcvH [Actinomycetota bacterium]